MRVIFWSIDRHKLMHSASIDTIKVATVTMREPTADYRSMSTDEILDSLATLRLAHLFDHLVGAPRQRRWEC